MALGALMGGSGAGLVAAAAIWTAGLPFWLALLVYAFGGAAATLALALNAHRERAPAPDRSLARPAMRNPG